MNAQTTVPQLIKRVRASVRRAQAKADKAMKAAKAFSTIYVDQSGEKRKTAANTRHKPIIGVKNK
jgi:hypothetical protein